jgi:hypothetical protein
LQVQGFASSSRLNRLGKVTTGQPLPAPSKLTLYFTEFDLAPSTARTDEQLDEFRAQTLEVARRMRSGNFAANPDYRPLLLVRLAPPLPEPLGRGVTARGKSYENSPESWGTSPLKQDWGSVNVRTRDR